MVPATQKREPILHFAPAHLSALRTTGPSPGPPGQVAKHLLTLLPDTLNDPEAVSILDFEKPEL